MLCIIQTSNIIYCTMMHTMTYVISYMYIYTYDQPKQALFPRLHIPSGMGLSWGMLRTLCAPSRWVSTKHGLLREKHGNKIPTRWAPTSYTRED